MTEPEYRPERGIIRMPRTHLEAITGGDHAALDPADPVGALLVELGVVANGRVDAALAPVLDVLRRPSARFALRIETARGVARHRGWVGADGVVTVEGGSGPADVLDIRITTRATAAARVVADRIGLGPVRPVQELPEEPLPWDEVVAPVRYGTVGSWAEAAFGAAADLSLAHLRWARDPAARATTAMVTVAATDGGLVEARPGDDGCSLSSRSPLEVWTALCALART